MIKRLSLLAILLLAFALRLYRLDAQSLWYDEGVTATLSRYTPVELVRWTAQDIQPPFYYLLVSAWARLAGWSEWSLRFPSVFFGLLAVPLLAVLAQRLSQAETRIVGKGEQTSPPALRASGQVAMVTALFTALHPMLVYYSQEARMYTLLVALGILVAIQEDRGMRGEGWGGYVVAAVAALYTHYFALFLLVALAIYRMIEMIRTQWSSRHPVIQSPSPPHLQKWLLANSLLFILYLPWLWVIFRQLRTDSSYWQGSLKGWEALHKIAISFTLGETVLESQAPPFLWLFGLIMIASLFLILYRNQQATLSSLLYALLWLLLPILFLLILASFTPKFQPRYAIIALPGLILFWSLIIERIRFSHSPCLPLSLSPPLLVSLSIALSIILSIPAASLYSLNQWFFTPAHTKDQWRELAQFVRQQVQPNEKVVLVSGHAWPILDYYAPELAPVRLPDIDILNVNAILDYTNSAKQLSNHLVGASGVWLVNWQEEVVDPTDMAGMVLGLAGNEVPVEAQFWHLRLRHFTDLQTIQPEPPIAKSLNLNIGNQLTLLGYSQNAQDDLLLFWRANPTPSKLDLKLAGELRTSEHLRYHRIGDRRPANYQYPTFAWQAGSLVMGRLSTLEWAGEGAQAGNYHLALGLYEPAGDPAGLDILDAHNQPTGKRLQLDLTLQHNTPYLSPLPASSSPVQITAISPDALEAGNMFTLDLLWHVTENSPLTQPLYWQWHVPQGLRSHKTLPFENLPSSIQTGQPIRQVVRLTTPLDLPVGVANLSIRNNADESAITQGQLVSVPVTIVPSTRNFTPPSIQVALNQSFDVPLDYITDNTASIQSIALLGLIEPLPSRLSINRTISISLVWQASEEWYPISADYRLSLQLLNEQGELVTQRGDALPNGTASWQARQVETSTLSMTMPSVPGRYRLIAVLYDPIAAGMPRLRLPEGQDFVEVGWVEVGEGE